MFFISIKKSKSTLAKKKNVSSAMRKWNSVLRQWRNGIWKARYVASVIQKKLMSIIQVITSE